MSSWRDKVKPRWDAEPIDLNWPSQTTTSQQHAGKFVAPVPIRSAPKHIHPRECFLPRVYPVAAFRAVRDEDAN